MATYIERDPDIFAEALLMIEDEAICAALFDAVHPTAWHLTADVTKALVAHIGLAALDGLLVRAGFAEAQSPRLGKVYKSNLLSLEAMLPLQSVRVAPVAAAGMNHKSARRHALAWILAHPKTAAAGLVPIALGRDKKAAAGAAEGLRSLAAAGHEVLVREAAITHPDPASAGIEAVLATDPLALKNKPKTPSWLKIGDLAALRLRDGTRLPKSAREIFVQMLSATLPDAPYPGIEPAINACDPASLAAFGRSLLHSWILAGAPSKDSWALTGLSHIADDETTRRLAELVAL